ncbi:MAG: EamA family transporter [Candidatus Rokuibacteriota bacterium]|nr:MAG: EamA family transporter [Candidatus Rokubacteria bacterium]
MATRPRLSIAAALGAAALFGLSVPAGKALLTVTDPWLLAGLLYLGSGVSLGACRLAQRFLLGGRAGEARLGRSEWPWLAAAIFTGGVIAPVLLMFGLSRAAAAEAALMLNLEGVLTAVVAWVVFREHVNRRIAGGMVAIAAGAMVLAWNPTEAVRLSGGAVLIAGACLGWAIDNNLTRKVSASDPLQIAAMKGLVAGGVNIGIALSLGASIPNPTTVGLAALLGLLSYGVSLILFVLALRDLGAGRTSAYFSTAPFVGALIGVLLLGEPVTGRLGVAAGLMMIGVWLHVSERHEHEHVHELLEHEHRHEHDAHHRHGHDSSAPPGEPHSHRHVHERLLHSHPHYPDIHHRHGH